MALYEGEGLYIAGPMCFMKGGYDLWWAERKLAESKGVSVVLPTSTPLKLDQKNKKLNAKEIFDDLIYQVNRTSVIIACLDNFRGSESDGGTVYEIGWIWSKGGRIYGYSRDMRSVCEKNSYIRITNGKVFAENNLLLPYYNMPAAPSIVGSSRLLEGSFEDALNLYISDIHEEERCGRAFFPQVNELSLVERDKQAKRVYLATQDRYAIDAEKRYMHLKEIALSKGWVAVSPLDYIPGFDYEGPSLYASSACDLKRRMSLLKSCDAILADLNDLRGFEPASDIAFECGAAYGFGLNCVGYMDDTSIMQERIPHIDELEVHNDIAGYTIENFSYPINLMFSCSFDIIQGNCKSALLSLIAK